MNTNERVAVAEIWGVIAATCGKDLNQVSLKMMVDAVDDLPGNEVVAALQRWFRETKTHRFPLPAEVRYLVRPKPSSRVVAIELARKIDKALMSHGYVWESGYFSSNGYLWESNTGSGRISFPSFKDAVIAELGEIGWHAICSRGGWSRLIESQKVMDEGQFIAQLRDQIESSTILAEQGVDVAMIEMPKRSDAGNGSISNRSDVSGALNEQVRFGDVMKLVPRK